MCYSLNVLCEAMESKIYKNGIGSVLPQLLAQIKQYAAGDFSESLPEMDLQGEYQEMYETLRTLVDDFRKKIDSSEAHLREVIRETEKVGQNNHQLKSQVSDLEKQVKQEQDKHAQLEANLKKNSHLLSETEHIAGIGSWEWNIAEGRIYLSPEWQRIHGVDAESLAMDDLIPVAHPDDIPAINKAFEASLKEGKPYDIRHRIIRPNDGTVRLIKSYGEMRFSEKGEPERMLGTARDITEQQQREQAIRSEKDKAQMYLDTAEVLFVALNADGNVTMVNRKGCDILGHPCEDIIGCNWFDTCLPGRIRPAIKDVFEKLMKGQFQPDKHFEHEVICKDGEERIISWSNAILRDETGAITGTLSSGSDITEERKARQKLSEREEELSKITDNMPALISYVDAEGYFRFVNREFERWFDMTRDKIVGMHYKELVGKDSYERIRKYIDSALDGETVEYEMFMPYPYGISRWVRKMYVPKTTEKGEGDGFFALVTDISELKKTQSEREKLLKNLRERVKELKCIFSVVSAIRKQDSLKDIFREVVRLIPAGWQYPEITRARVTFDGREYVSRPFDKSPWKLESSIIVNEIKRGDVEVYYTIEKPAEDTGPFIKEEKSLLDNIARNISEAVESREAEETLRWNEQFLSDITANVPGMIFQYEINKEGEEVFNYVSEGVNDLLGVEASDIMKNSRVLWDTYLDEYIPDIVQKIRESKEKGTPWYMEYQVKTTDRGKVKWVEGYGVPKSLPGGSTIWYGWLRDVSERKFAEEENKRLIRELNTKRKELEHVLYATSHDLRSPLVNVQGFNQELQISLTELQQVMNIPDVPEKVRNMCNEIVRNDITESINFIASSTTKMDDLLSGLLTLSRLGRQEVKKTRLDMNKIIKEVTKEFQFQIKEQKIKVEVSKMPDCYGDPKLINRVFSNLLGNAIKFLRPGMQGIIKVFGVKEANYARYYVADNGIGMNPDYKKKIFEIFNKLDPATEGRGLGLTIVKQILERHGGNISVEAEEGKGACFTISLPVNNQEQ